MGHGRVGGWGGGAGRKKLYHHPAPSLIPWNPLWYHKSEMKVNSHARVTEGINC